MRGRERKVAHVDTQRAGDWFALRRGKAMMPLLADLKKP
jgi:hypothetical protein